MLFVSVPLTESCHLVNIMSYENVVKHRITPKNGDAVRYVCIRVVFIAPSTSWGVHMVIARQTGRRCVASRRCRRRRIRHGGDLQGGVICRRCNAKAVNLRGGELRCGEIGAVIVSAAISEAVKCGAPS